jgi:hypothetical protein
MEKCWWGFEFAQSPRITVSGGWGIIIESPYPFPDTAEMMRLWAVHASRDLNLHEQAARELGLAGPATAGRPATFCAEDHTRLRDLGVFNGLTAQASWEDCLHGTRRDPELALAAGYALGQIVDLPSGKSAIVSQTVTVSFASRTLRLYGMGGHSAGWALDRLTADSIREDIQDLALILER